MDVVSRRGRVRNVELRITETIAPGQIFVPFHYAEANANEATQSAFDPVSREPNYKQSAVRVEKVNAQLPTDRGANSHKKRGGRSGVGSWGLGVIRPAGLHRGASNEAPGRGRQRHGRDGLRRADSEARPEVSDHRVRRRDARQLQPRDAVVGARRREVGRRDHHQHRASGTPGTTSTFASACASSMSMRTRRRSPATTAASRRTTRCCWRPAVRHGCRRSTDSTRTACSSSARSTTRGSCCADRARARRPS